MSPTVDVAALLDGKSWSTYQKLVTVLTALAIIFDGFDIQILGFAIPSLIKEWHVTRADFGPVLAVGLAGMVVGGPLAGYFGDRFGRRGALIGCVVLFGLATIATAFGPSSFAAACSVCLLRPVMATFAPSATNSFAVARPMPLFPPVMNAVLFASRTGASSVVALLNYVAT